MIDCKRNSLYSYIFIGTLIFLMVPGTFVGVLGQSDGIFYVSPAGKDTNSGSREQPMKTLETARDAARKDTSGSNRIVIMAGEYFLSKPFELNTQDNGLIVEGDSSGKVIINGGSIINNWYRDGDNFWCSDLPEVKEGLWDFRSLVVNGRMVDRARYPDSGTFFHQQVWDVKLFPTIPESWERKPTPEELITMAYNPKDIPRTLDVKNAEVRVYHMWNESLVGVARNDTLRNELIFSTPCINAPGAFGIKKYIIWNTREGMTRPGQWYLDRTKGRVVYWPLKDEVMVSAKVIAPRIEEIFTVSGTKEKNVEEITIRGLIFNITTIPLKPAGFGATAFKGAVNFAFANRCTIDNLEIFNVAGLGVTAQQMSNCRFINCDIHNTGGAGVKFNGYNSFISQNKVHDIGLNYPSAAGIYVNGDSMHIYRNEVYNIPYSGMIVGGTKHLVEENHIYRVMRELHDGAAIYGSGKKWILRGNLVHDIVADGRGFGISAYYFDAGASENIVERNVSINVNRPIHCHVASNIIYRDNTFITEKDMVLSFQRSADVDFERNTLIVPGKLSVTQANGIKTWKDNIIYRNGKEVNNVLQAFTIDSTMPTVTYPSRKTEPAKAVRVTKQPVLDGNIELNEWPGEFHYLGREPSRLSTSGWPPIVKFSYDDKNIYLGITVVMLDPTKISVGSVWGKDDGLELSVAGKNSDGKPGNYLIRLYSDGTFQSLTDAGLNIESANRLKKEIRIVTKAQQPQKKGGGWSSEWAIPFKVLGIKPSIGMKIAFNLCAFSNEYGKWHCWEGTEGEGWNMDKAGILELR